ncbi:MAG: fasciclin domain-containing protein [Cyclobacteriaceae bacterium]
MKNIKNRILKFWFVGVIFLVTVSCDLGLQTEWEYVKEPLGNVPTGMTAFEWITMINQDTTYNTNDSTAQFSYLLEAIEMTGMQDVFNDPNSQKTFFLLRNGAWNGGGQLLAHMTGSADYPLDSIDDINRLKAVLNYHILPDDVIDQSGTIPRSDFHFYYQTMIPGDTGIVEINQRLWNAQIRLNQNVDKIGSPDIASSMPGSAKGASVSLHNYRFTNGVGHQMNAYVRYQPF